MDDHALLIRLVGTLVAGHGAQKLFGWFGGSGPRGTTSSRVTFCRFGSHGPSHWRTDTMRALHAYAKYDPSQLVYEEMRHRPRLLLAMS